MAKTYHPKGYKAPHVRLHSLLHRYILWSALSDQHETYLRNPSLQQLDSTFDKFYMLHSLSEKTVMSWGCSQVNLISDISSIHLNLSIPIYLIYAHRLISDTQASCQSLHLNSLCHSQTGICLGGQHPHG